MSISEPSPTRGISNWWKNIKKHSNLSNESVNETNKSIDNLLVPNESTSSTNKARPMNFKSRSLNAVKPNNGGHEQLIRQQRDEFMASQNKFGFGNEVFGVPLEQSIQVAESLISVPSDDPDEFIKYGKVPLLVGKCGSFLKANGLKVEGIFRVAGASRRVKELQFIFSTQPEYGRKLNWEGYTVHDAASVFRRFLNNLPEPLVPLELYEEFRDPVRSRPRILNHIKTRNETIEKKIMMIQQKQASPDQSNTNREIEPEEKTELQKQKDLRKQKRIAKDLRNALKEYIKLFDKLPLAQRHLLCYLLDMLTMFSENSKDNLMTARNLAAIFQPSILSHPNHDLHPEEYASSQAVVEVLIEYSKRLLPDVKKFATDSKRSSIVNTDPESNKNSQVNLLAVRNSTRGSRPHSRSLSSANCVPDTLSPTTVTQESEHDDQHGDDNNESSDDEYNDNSNEEHKFKGLEIPIPTITTNIGTNEVNTELNGLSIRKPKQRPISMFLGSPPAHYEQLGDDSERRSRSKFLSKSPPLGSDGDEGIGSESFGSKKGSWFKRLRSTSRSNDS